MMTTLCLAVVGAMIFDRLSSRYGRGRSGIAAVVMIGVMADTWMTTMPLAQTPRTFAALECAGGATGPMIELPLGDPYPDVSAMYRQMFHGRPIVNGYSGYFPPHYSALRFGLTLRDPDVITQFAAHGINDIVVNRSEDPGGKWDDYVKSHPHARLLCTEGKQSLYRVTLPQAASTSSAARPLPIALIRPTINTEAVALMIDQDLMTRWESGPQTERAAVEIDIGVVRPVAGIDLMLGPFVQDLFSTGSGDRKLRRRSVVAGALARRQRRSGVCGCLRGTARRAAEISVCRHTGEIHPDASDGQG
jgi:hypothetical protein